VDCHSICTELIVKNIIDIFIIVKHSYIQTFFIESKKE